MSSMYDKTMNDIDIFLKENEPINNTDQETSAYFIILAFLDYFKQFRDTIYNPIFITEMKKAVDYGLEKNCLPVKLALIHKNEMVFHVRPIFFDTSIFNDYEKYAVVFGFGFDNRAEYQLAFFQDKDDEGYYRYNPYCAYEGDYDHDDFSSNQQFNEYFYDNVKPYIKDVFQVMSKYDKYSDLLNRLENKGNHNLEYWHFPFSKRMFYGKIFFNVDGSCYYSVSIENVKKNFVDAIWSDDHRISIREKLKKDDLEILKRIPLKTQYFNKMIQLLYDERKDWKPFDSIPDSSIKQYALTK